VQEGTAKSASPIISPTRFSWTICYYIQNDIAAKFAYNELKNRLFCYVKLLQATDRTRSLAGWGGAKR